MPGRRIVVLIALAAMAVCAGCAPTLDPQSQQELNEGSQAFQNQQYVLAIREMDAFLREHPTGPGTDEAHYIRGLSKYRLGDRDGARADLTTATSQTQHDHIRINGYNALGDLAWDADDMEQGERMYRRVLDYAPGESDEAIHARYRLGCVLQRKGDWREADLQFERVIHYAGETDLGARAARRVRAQAWTVQVGAFENRERAEQLAASLEEQNLPAMAQEVTQGGRLLLLVQIGRYTSYEEAMSVLRRLEQQGREGFVTVTR